MSRICPGYQRLLRAYERTFSTWLGSGNPEDNAAVDACLAQLEKNYQALTDHQQSCPVCLRALGKGPPQAIDLSFWREGPNGDRGPKKARAS